MRLHLIRVDVVGDEPGSIPITDSQVVTFGPLEVAVDASDAPAVFRWALGNRGGEPARVRAVRLIFAVGHAGPLRMYRHGYQSWSPSGVATLGVDVDPSSVGDTDDLWLARGENHADGDPVGDPHELRSEMVTLLADADDERRLLGFDGGAHHDGTFRLRRTDDGTVELAAEAFLGDVRLDPGVERPFHAVVTAAGQDHSVLLEDWAAGYGQAAGARVAAPYQVGWCSWYHYFGNVTQSDLDQNLALADSWPFEVFQLDDGYQAAIGDWLTLSDRFGGSSLDAVASSIAAAGHRPGLWIAPFLAVPHSQLATEHPEWIARHPSGGRLLGMMHPVWGGATHTLDTTRPEVIEHLEGLGRDLVAAGFTYLKLDFTYAPGFDGVFADPTATPAERVRAGFDAIRRGAGDDTFILGCGAPLGACVGVVDGMRIGADVAPSWPVPEHSYRPAGYVEAAPGTVNGYQNTLTRSFLHRRLWLNDPDCLMLRTSETALSQEAARTWAHAVGLSGGMALVSDDLSLLDDDARRLLDEVIELGQASDAEAVAASAAAAARSTGGDGAHPPRCPDLLEAAIPTTFTAAGRTLVTDPTDGTSLLT